MANCWPTAESAMKIITKQITGVLIRSPFIAGSICRRFAPTSSAWPDLFVFITTACGVSCTRSFANRRSHANSPCGAAHVVGDLRRISVRNPGDASTRSGETHRVPAHHRHRMVYLIAGGEGDRRLTSSDPLQ